MKIILGCQKNDELKSLCEEFFGDDNVEVLNRNGILSLDEVEIIITIVSVTVDIISFLYSVLADRKQVEDLNNTNKEDTQNSNNTSTRRVVITKEGDINIEGYTLEQVSKLISRLGDR